MCKSKVEKADISLLNLKGMKGDNWIMIGVAYRRKMSIGRATEATWVPVRLWSLPVKQMINFFGDVGVGVPSLFMHNNCGAFVLVDNFVYEGLLGFTTSKL